MLSCTLCRFSEEVTRIADEGETHTLSYAQNVMKADNDVMCDVHRSLTSWLTKAEAVKLFNAQNIGML